MKRLFLIVIYLLSITSTFSQNTRFAKRQFISPKGDTLNYRFLSPDYNPGRKYPLVVFLHGSGERGNNNDSQLQWGVTNFANDEMMTQYPAYVLAPQCPSNQSWANLLFPAKGSMDIKLLPEPTRPMQSLIALIDTLVTKVNIDVNRIYITGLSMGGMGTFDAISRYPDKFAAAVPVCGAGDTSKAKLISKIPIWIIHGNEDPSVDSRASLEMVNALVRAGGKPGFTLIPETGHFSWLAAYIDRSMLQWLFRQHK